MPWAPLSEILEIVFIIVRLCLLGLDSSCINPRVAYDRQTHSHSLLLRDAVRYSPTLCPASVPRVLLSFCCYLGGGHRYTTRFGFFGSLLGPSYSHLVSLCNVI